VASALTALKNATVVFTVADSGTTVDPDTGNVLANTTTLSYELFLRKGGQAFKGGVSQRTLPGVDTVAAVFEGYCISPQSLDARIRQGTIGKLTFGGDVIEECVVDDLRFSYGTTGLLGSTLQQVLGDKIRLSRFWQQ
jgi:hypothetical protein